MQGAHEERNGKSWPFALEEPPPKGSPRPTESADVPLVLPSERKVSLRKRRGRLVLVSVAVLVAAAAGVVYLGVDAVPEPAAPGVFGSPAGEGAMAGALEEATARFAAAAESYEERSGDFDLGRFGCDGLWRGYRAVDEAFVTLSAGYAAAEKTEMVERAYATSKRSMERVEGHFSASGCPRAG